MGKSQFVIRFQAKFYSFALYVLGKGGAAQRRNSRNRPQCRSPLVTVSLHLWSIIGSLYKALVRVHTGG